MHHYHQHHHLMQHQHHQHHPLFNKHALELNSNSNHPQHSNQTSIHSKHQSTSTSNLTNNFNLCYLQTGATLTGHQSTIKSKPKRNHPSRSRSQSQSHLPSSSTTITRSISSNQQLTINSHAPIIPSSVIFDPDELYLLHNSSLAPVQVPNLSFGSVIPPNSYLNYSLSSLTTTTTQPINHIINPKDSNWEVKVIITEIDVDQMKLNGIMKARSEIKNQELITTSWKGEIIDFDHHFLYTHGKWANDRIEKEFWSKTKAFDGYKDQLDSVEDYQAFQDRIHQDFVLMRWKETHFVNCEADQSGLSIQGFYFVCQSKSNGSIEAFYYDPSTITLQRLSLKLSGSQGIGFGTMNLA